MRVYFDLEANEFLEKVTRVWCIAAEDLDSDKTWFWGPDEVDDGVRFLEECDYIVGHNSVRYDAPVLRKLLNFQPKAGQCHEDTLVMARLKYPNLKQTDGPLVAAGKLHSKLHGRDSLEAWGQRIGVYKMTYEGGFEAYNESMGTYCAQDVKTGKALWHYLNPHETIDPFCLATEHRIAHITNLMEIEGWPLNVLAAQALHVRLKDRHGELESALVAKYGSWEEVDKVYIAKKDNKKRGIKAGDEVTNYKTVVFNPGSRRHIEKVLKATGWQPQVFTDAGSAKLDEEILEKLDIPEAKDLIEYLLIQKRLGMLAEGDNAWIKLVDANGLLHPSYNCLGTVTGRASHYNPNIAQVPSVGSPYGAECRELFIVLSGWRLVGADFEGLELRCFAHWIAKWDGGAYAEAVVNGDVHWLTVQYLGLVPMGTERDAKNPEHKAARDIAKTFIYAFLYGAGVAKLAKILGVPTKRAETILAEFLGRFPALKKLKKAVATAATKGYLKGLDGRHIPVRSEHAALNSLLQSMGAVLCKSWVIDAYDALIASGLEHGWNGDFVILGWIHDEIQVACREGLEEEVSLILVKCAQAQTQKFKLNVRLDSSAVVGGNWKETH